MITTHISVVPAKPNPGLLRGKLQGTGRLVMLARVSMLCLALLLTAPHLCLAITITNESSSHITAVETSGDQSAGWADDVLRGSVILPGSTYIVDLNEESGACELRVRISSQNTEPLVFDGLCATATIIYEDSATATEEDSATGAERAFTLSNATTDFMVWIVHASPSVSEDWGEDLLGNDEPIQPGNNREFSLAESSECSYDVRAITVMLLDETPYQAKTYEFFDVDMCTSSQVFNLEQPATQSFLAVNEGEAEVLLMYVQEPDSNQDEMELVDRLGQLNTLPPGSALWIDMESDFRPGSCRFSIAIVKDQREQPPVTVYPDIDLCRNDIVRLPPDRFNSRDGRMETARTSISTSTIGTAFAISERNFLTNYHVVDNKNCEQFAIGPVSGGDPTSRRVVVGVTSPEEDTAVLVLDREARVNEVFAQFRREAVKLDENVVAFGYPQSGVMSRYGVAAWGILGAHSGHKSSTRQYQLMMPVHPGSSGSPLLDENGYVLGVIVAKNKSFDSVSYAIKGSTVLSFLESANVKVSTGESTRDDVLTTPEVVEKAT